MATPKKNTRKPARKTAAAQKPKIANPLTYDRPGPDGKLEQVVVDGDEMVPIPRSVLARTANNLEAAFRKGAFSDQQLETVNSVVNLTLYIKEKAIAPVE